VFIGLVPHPHLSNGYTYEEGWAMCPATSNNNNHN